MTDERKFVLQEWKKNIKLIVSKVINAEKSDLLI